MKFPIKTTTDREKELAGEIYKLSSDRTILLWTLAGAIAISFYGCQEIKSASKERISEIETCAVSPRGYEQCMAETEWRHQIEAEQAEAERDSRGW